MTLRFLEKIGEDWVARGSDRIRPYAPLAFCRNDCSRVLFSPRCSCSSLWLYCNWLATVSRQSANPHFALSTDASSSRNLHAQSLFHFIHRLARKRRSQSLRTLRSPFTESTKPQGQQLRPGARPPGPPPANGGSSATPGRSAGLRSLHMSILLTGSVVAPPFAAVCGIVLANCGDDLSNGAAREQLLASAQVRYCFEFQLSLASKL